MAHLTAEMLRGWGDEWASVSNDWQPGAAVAAAPQRTHSSIWGLYASVPAAELCRIVRLIDEAATRPLGCSATRAANWNTAQSCTSQYQPYQTGLKAGGGRRTARVSNALTCPYSRVVTCTGLSGGEGIDKGFTGFQWIPQKWRDTWVWLKIVVIYFRIVGQDSFLFRCSIWTGYRWGKIVDD